MERSRGVPESSGAPGLPSPPLLQHFRAPGVCPKGRPRQFPQSGRQVTTANPGASQRIPADSVHKYLGTRLKGSRSVGVRCARASRLAGEVGFWEVSRGWLVVQPDEWLTASKLAESVLSQGASTFGSVTPSQLANSSNCVIRTSRSLNTARISSRPPIASMYSARVLTQMSDRCSIFETSP